MRIVNLNFAGHQRGVQTLTSLNRIILLATILWLSFPVQAQTTIRYVHTDALGSVVAESDSSGVVIERRKFEPYGQQLTPALQDGPGFTGHVQDATTGLTYMQQRYYDPAIGRFLSVDPITASSISGSNFNRYWYANNNPYRFKDPDGRLSRGSGWTDRQWQQFDRAQQSAARSLEKAAGKISSSLETGRGAKGVSRSFERTFGAGSATPENMAKAASDMSGMAAALRDTGESAIPANGMTTAQINEAYGGDNTNTLAAVPRNGPSQVIVNTVHADFGSSSKLSWAAGHETAHAVFGYRDATFNGSQAYKFGSPAQIDSFNNLPGAQRLTNPDHLMDFAK